MIEFIRGQVRFQPSGATISVDFQPKEGITAVVGENGSGKTFTAVESLRYLLFGTRALRAPLFTIETLELTGRVRIHGAAYTFERGLSAARIVDARGYVLAVGQEEVSRKAVELLGYGLEVFDLCNAAMQGKTQSLGDLTPSKRKEKIDEVLKVSNVRAVEKACREEANSLRREAEATARSLPALSEAPKAPDNYVGLEALERELRSARDVEARRHELRSQLKTVSVPEMPSVPRITEQLMEDVRTADELRRHLVDFTDCLSAEDISNGEKLHDWLQMEAARGPEPEEPLADVERDLQTWSVIEALEQIPDIDVTCPECSHEFSTRSKAPPAPAKDKAYLLVQLARHEKHATPLPPKPEAREALTKHQALQAHQVLDVLSESNLARKKLAEREWPTMSLEEMMRVSNEWGRYDSLTQAAAEAEATNQRVEAALALLPDVDVEALNEAFSDARVYEAALDRYLAGKDQHTKLSAEIADLQRRSEEFFEGNKVLAEERAALKAFLAPALTREATTQIHDMTNGVLKSLVVDEDMAITVDGQLLETLSGAGKTVANLALRVALTKVLTGTAFPVFIGDEMDGDLDVKRREATTQAMVSLKNHLKQIILITHKDVDIADHVIDLGE